MTEYPVVSDTRWGWGRDPNPTIEKLLAEGIGDIEPLASQLCELLPWCQTVPATAGDGDLCWDNTWWGTIDAVMQAHVLRRGNPALYLEVGSGYSTRFARHAIEHFGLQTRIVAVDPHPRTGIDDVADEVIRRPFGEVGRAVMDRLGPGDVFVLDSSHLGVMGSEAVWFFNELIDSVPKGCTVCIDDIFLPWDYHPTWAGRFYGEQYLLAAWLLGGHAGWSVELPSWFAAAHHDGALFEPLWPTIENRHGRVANGFWIRRDDDS